MAESRSGNFRAIQGVIFCGFFTLLLFSLFPYVSAETEDNQSQISAIIAPVPDVIFFYGDGCVHCENIRPLINGLAGRHPDVNFQYLEVYHNSTNRNRFLEIALSQNTTAGVPALVVGKTLLVGESEIRDKAEEEIILLELGYSGVNPNTTQGDNGNCPTTTTGLTLPLVIGCALVDSINPCGLAVLVFLLIPMAAAESRKRILFAGGAYIFATFLFHLLVGIGLFSIISISGFSKIFALAGGIVAITFGLINIADLLRNKETFFLSISESRKGLVAEFARKATLPASFILGILAGIFGFTCTGGIYISILGLMGQGMGISTGLPWLVLYNIIFVLPLILITLLVAYGLPPEQADQLREGYKRPFRAVISVVLIILGMMILLGWLG